MGDGKPIPPWKNEISSYCISGALAKVLYNNGEYFNALLSSTIFDILDHKVGKRIHDWNDDPQRTQTEVLNLLEELINMYL